MISKDELNFSEAFTRASEYVDTGELHDSSVGAITIKLKKYLSQLSQSLQEQNKEKVIEMQNRIFQRAVQDYNSEFRLAEKLIAFNSFIEMPFSHYSPEIQDHYRVVYETLLARANEYHAVTQSTLYDNTTDQVPQRLQEIDHNMDLLNKLGNKELKQAALTDHILWKALLQCNKDLTQKDATKLLEKYKGFLKTIGLDKQIKFDPSKDTHSMDSIDFQIRTERLNFKASIESYQKTLNKILSNQESSLHNSVSSSPDQFFHHSKKSVSKATENHHQISCTIQ